MVSDVETIAFAAKEGSLLHRAKAAKCWNGGGSKLGTGKSKRDWLVRAPRERLSCSGFAGTVGGEKLPGSLA